MTDTTTDRLNTPVEDIPDLIRAENTPIERMFQLGQELVKPTYTHEEIYGNYCTLQGHIDAPPEAVWEYLADIKNLDEYTISTRAFEPTDKEGLYVGWDRLAADTRIYMKIEGNREALTLDYHCAWDQGDDLWMIYLFRLVPSELVLNKPGTVVLWTNCHHPYYDKNPYPELAPSPDRPWVGDMWDLFYAGHYFELVNLRKILEHRHGTA